MSSSIDLDPLRERRHQPSDGGRWSEHHRLCAVDADGSLAVALQIAIRFERTGSSPTADFNCVVFGLEALPVVVTADDIPVPADRWEFRTSGLWVDNVCETPFRHWSYGLEAFGLAIDEPDELLGRGYGDRVPVGWEIEFEGDPANAVTGDSAQPGGGGHDHQIGRFHGVLLGAAGELAVDGPAKRSHRWGLDGDLVTDPITDPRAGLVSRQADPGPAAASGNAATGNAATGNEGSEQAVALPTGDEVWRVAFDGATLSWFNEPRT
jgi:hypothetical protein